MEMYGYIIPLTLWERVRAELLSDNCHPELVGATLREDSFQVSGSVVNTLKIRDSEINSE